MRSPNGGLRSCRRYQNLPPQPFSAVPIAALVFAEAEFLVRTPVPIVLMNDDTRFMGKVMRFMRMPADVALAYDRRGCTEGRDRDRRKVSVEAAPDVDFCKLIGFAVGITAQFASFSGRAQVRFDFNQACGRCQTHCQSRSP